MRTVHQLEDLKGEPGPLVIAAGAFDGVHLGHRAVLQLALDEAKHLGGSTWVMTFDPHPLKVLRPSAAPALLTATPHKLSLLAGCGLTGTLVLPFNHEFAHQEPEAFIQRLRQNAPALKTLVVGENWTFGHKARGNVALLRELAAGLGFSVRVAGPVVWQDEVISSTRIRKAVAAGDLDAAGAMLGRPFSLMGTVIHGKQLGRQLGFPTANVYPQNEVRPPAGIYAARVRVGTDLFPSAAYFGNKKTHPDGDIVEAHLIDHTLELYGQEVEVSFIRKLREDRTFPTLDALKAQIALDVDHAREMLRGERGEI